MSKAECRKVLAHLWEYLDSELDHDRAGRLEAHLKSCPECRARAETLCKCLQSAAGMPDAPLAPEARNAAIAALKALKRSGKVER